MYDLIIVGGGPAGLSCAIHSRRFLIKTLIVTQSIGGLLPTIPNIENWTGEVSILGYELAKKLENHALALGAEIMQDKVVKVEKEKVYTNSKEISCKAILISTGSVRKRLGVKGEGKFYGKGVSYCATCDGPLFKGKTVAVIGNNSNAVEEALFLADYVKEVYFVGDYEGPYLKYLKDKNIKIIREKVKEIYGDDVVKGIVLESSNIKLDGVFVNVGMIPQTSFLEGIKLNKKREIVVDKNYMTNIKGIFAAGDCTNNKIKQIFSAAYQGMAAAYSIYDYLNT